MDKSSYASYGDWYGRGPLSPYVSTFALAGDTMLIIEATQPAGDMSDPPVDDLVLMRTVSNDIPFDFDLGGGRFSGSEHYGDFHLAPPNTATDIQVHAPHSTQLFSLPAKTCHHLLKDEDDRRLDFGALHSRLFRSDILSALCERLVALIRHPHPPSRLFVDGTAMMVLAELTVLAGQCRQKQYRTDIRDWRVRRIIEQMETRLGEDVSMTELASGVDLSLSHCAALFRAATGLPPHAWRTQRRIERACEFLSGTRRPITDIALALGFSSSQHFATAFRSHKGVSPSVWRQQRKG